MSSRFESQPDTLEDVAVDEPEADQPALSEPESADDSGVDELGVEESEAGGESVSAESASAEETASAEQTASGERDAGEKWVPSPVPRTGQQQPAQARRSRGRFAARMIVITAVVAVLLAVASGILWWLTSGNTERQERDRAITVAARTEVLSLLTLSPETVQQSFDKVVAGSTGAWRDEFARQSEQFTQAVRNGQVRSTATITGSGLQEADENHARAMVAASSQIKNADTPNGYPGAYRILLDLEQRDGRWLVSDLKFVP